MGRFSQTVGIGMLLTTVSAASLAAEGMRTAPAPAGAGTTSGQLDAAGSSSEGMDASRSAASAAPPPNITVTALADDRIRLEVSKRSLRDALAALQANLGIQVLGEVALEDRVTPIELTAEGELDAVIGRLLKNYNHIFSYDARQNVKSVMILGEEEGESQGPQLVRQRSSEIIRSGEEPPEASPTRVAAEPVDPSNPVPPEVRARRELKEALTTMQTAKRKPRFMGGRPSVPTVAPPVAGQPTTSASATAPLGSAAPEVPVITPEMQEQLKALTQQAVKDVKAIAAQLKKNDRELQAPDS